MIVSITHEHDLDGLGSQAVILRSLKMHDKNEDIKLIFAHYNNFVEKVKYTLSSDNLPSQLIISDIGFNEEFNQLFPIFENVKNKDCKIFWFDHHLVGQEVKRNLKNLIHIYINDKNKCATEVVKDYYLPNDHIAFKLAEFARDTDFRIDKSKLASNLQLIIGFNRGEENNDNKIKIVELLSRGEFEHPWLKDQLKILQKWFKKESKFAIKHARILRVNNFGDIVISHAKLGGGKITLLLNDEFPNRKAYFGIDTRYNEIIIHSDHVKCRDFAREFKGGGHKFRAGFKYPKIFKGNDILNEEFIQDIEKALIKYLKY